MKGSGTRNIENQKNQKLVLFFLVPVDKLLWKSALENGERDCDVFIKCFF